MGPLRMIFLNILPIADKINEKLSRNQPNLEDKKL